MSTLQVEHCVALTLIAPGALERNAIVIQHNDLNWDCDVLIPEDTEKTKKNQEFHNHISKSLSVLHFD